QQYLTLITQSAQLPQKHWGTRKHTAFALYRLQQDASRLFCDQFVKRSDIVQRRIRKVWQQRTKSLLNFLLRSRTHPSECASMETIQCSNHTATSALFSAQGCPMQTGELEESLVGL